ncbi:MAG: LytTR family DNA-binding domain-containing protein [Bacteroidales bacterium]|jgi:two-component system LytT family response regulator
MTLKCVIIDDEPLAIDVLAEHIAKTPFLELAQKFTNSVKAYEYLSDNKIDLLFIDIQMPDLSGLELVRKLKYQPAVIFTTAYDQYAIEDFKVDALDYLLKPVDYPEFLKAAEKAKKWIAARDIALSIKSDKEFLFIKSAYKIIRIDLKTIIYIQGMSEYVRIFRENAKPVMSLLNLKTLEEQLPPEMFMRVHKSYIVNLNKISEIESNSIVCGDGVIIPVSKFHKDKLQEYIDKNFMI